MSAPVTLPQSPYMTRLSWRSPMTKAHTKRGHAHAAISAKVSSGRLRGSAALYQWDGEEWQLLWEGSSGDDVSARPWRDVPDLTPSGDTVTISRKEYESLKDDARWRTCVENAGVDNWGGFSYAMEEFNDPEEAAE